MPPTARTHLLFVCSRNQWRSPTAEALFKNHPRYSARSAGTENGARIKVTACHLGWADLIFCMERKHADRLRERFPEELAGKRLITLRIPDDYAFMDAELIALLRSELAAYVDL
ncbi:MAG TPA: protein tyrosine phosphatase [Opitutaceae bacterium]